MRSDAFSFFENTRRPTGFGGKIMVSMMNLGHRALADWGLRFLNLPTNAAVLDCGCGGGANLKKLLKRCPNGSIRGVDYSQVSVEKSRKVNRSVIEAGRCEVLQASVAQLPFDEAQFDLVTAFETVYFWPELTQSFREVQRVLKPGGAFLICNECGGNDGKGEAWAKKISGMTVYGHAQLKAAMEQAGFHGIQIHENRSGWLCVVAQK